MPKLTDKIRTRIVQMLAMHDPPTKVAAAIYEEFGIKLTKQQCHAYDPTRAGAKPGEPGKKWHALFYSTREAFLSEKSAIPTQQQAVRLRWLNDMCVQALERKDYNRVASLLEQIAKEDGGKYTNRRVIELSEQDRDAFEWVAVLANALEIPPGEIAARLLKVNRENPQLLAFAWVNRVAKALSMTPDEVAIMLARDAIPEVMEIVDAERTQRDHDKSQSADSN